jgi:hypothetical protein|tara:strand:+ start:442 stop:717 length:276 start_codon:yes stop_codon:yes gene_type:complete
MHYLELKTWNSEHSCVWREIVSRFGQSEYDDEAKRTKHMATLKAEWEAIKYKRDRAVAYPSMADQLDDIYHNGVDEWKKTIKAVKDKYPKE